MGFLCWSLYFSKMKAVYGLYFLQMGVRIESVFQNDQSVYTSGSTAEDSIIDNEVDCEHHHVDQFEAVYVGQDHQDSCVAAQEVIESVDTDNVV